MRAALPLLGLLALMCTGCTRWHEVKVPPEQALAGSRPRDVLVMLESDTTHWFKLPRAELVGDSIVGHRKVRGQRVRLAVSLEDVMKLAVRERSEEANSGVKQAAQFAGIIAVLVLAPVALVAVWGH